MLLIALGSLGVEKLICRRPSELDRLSRSHRVTLADDSGGDACYSRNQRRGHMVNNIKEATEVGRVCETEVLEVRGIPGDGPPVDTCGTETRVKVGVAERNANRKARIAVGFDHGILLVVFVDVTVFVEQGHRYDVVGGIIVYRREGLAVRLRIGGRGKTDDGGSGDGSELHVVSGQG